MDEGVGLKAGRLFPGFPNGRLRHTPVPDVFFAELLPAIDDLAELKVTLYGLWQLQRQQRVPRHLALSELEADAALLAGLDPSGEQGQALLRQALAQAVGRGTFLRLQARDGQRAWFFLNSEQGRQGFEQAMRGEVTLAGGEPGQALQVAAEQPNIFKLYEQNIGLLQPLIVDQLRDAEDSYPAEWIAEAFQIAVEQNKRHWNYVRSILERWRQAGRGGRVRDDDDRQSYIRGKYGDRVAH